MSSKIETTCKYYAFCCLFLLFISLILGLFLYLILGIIYLVQDYHIVQTCSESNLWAYVLVAIILSFLRLTPIQHKTDDNKKIYNQIFQTMCLGFIEIGLAIWGGIELWNKSCDSLINTHIWYFGLVTFLLQSLAGSIYGLVVPFFLCITLEKDDEIEEVSQV